jgi:hypothetical protein
LQIPGNTYDAALESAITFDDSSENHIPGNTYNAVLESAITIDDSSEKWKVMK